MNTHLGSCHLPSRCPGPVVRSTKRLTRCKRSSRLLLTSQSPSIRSKDLGTSPGHPISVVFRDLNVVFRDSWTRLLMRGTSFSKTERGPRSISYLWNGARWFNGALTETKHPTMYSVIRNCMGRREIVTYLPHTSKPELLRVFRVYPMYFFTGITGPTGVRTMW